MGKREERIKSENYCNYCGGFCQYEAYKIHLDSGSSRFFCSECSDKLKSLADQIQEVIGDDSAKFSDILNPKKK